MIFRLIAVAGFLLMSGLPGFSADARKDSLPAVVKFNRDIRPILSDNCFSCHGPDKNKRKAGLQLNTKEGLFGEIKGVHPVTPGSLVKSEIFRRVTSNDPEEVMPESKSGKTLTPNQIALIKRWIEQGAKWEGHWAFTQPARAKIPMVRKKSWPRNPIDNFILSKLEAEGLSPSTEADRRTLIRRLSFDLTGLPPTLDEAAAFIKDNSPDAYEKLVDRLLASPHYGERMAVDWLDAVRYADTDGFHADNYRSVYPYRDYVINAFNHNMHFDQFTREQLGGDLMQDATVEQKIASTYNHLNRSTEEGGAQPKEYLAKYAADRVRTTSTTWLGATLGCAECHDHKFDPFTTRDFYSFEAFFADIKEPGVGKPEAMQVPSDAQSAKLKEFDSEIARWKQAMDTPTPELAAAQSEWEKHLAEQKLPSLSAWKATEPMVAADFNTAFAKVFAPERRGGAGIGKKADKQNWTNHPEWADGLVNAIDNKPNAATYLYRTITVDAAQNLNLSLGSDDGIKLWVNGGEVLSRNINRPAAPDQEKTNIDLKAGTNFVLIKIVNGAGDAGFYFQADTGIPQQLASVVKLGPDARSEKERAELAKYYRSIAPGLEDARAKLAAAMKQREEFTATFPTTLVTAAIEPRVMRILPRGNWMSDAGDIVVPAVPAFLPHETLDKKRLNRLDLADWIVSKENPLTARVFVNRLWKTFYGMGISKSIDDFGSRGEWPTHPELLDWLAVEFMDSGWDIKHIVRLMVTSATYRQASLTSDKLRERDPFNRLLARQSTFRLEAEMIRDNALSISGLLADQIGGPSVKPYQPAGYWDQLNFPKRTYMNDHGPAEYRRGLYTFWCRTFLQPSLMAFDAPSREECTVDRVNSNTPLQALALLNDPTYVEAARVFAEKVVRHGGSNPRDRIKWTFNRALDRSPSEQEYKLVDALYQKEIAHYNGDTADAGKLITSGESPVAKDLNPAELAAWTSVCRTVLNLHETITRF